MICSPFFRRVLCWLGLLLPATGGFAQSFTQDLTVDFYRDVSSRNLRGLGTRSDGRLIPGPEVQALKGDLPPGLLWDLVPLGENELLIGTGPEAEILRVELDAEGDLLRATPWADLGSGHIYALAALADGSVVAAASPGARIRHLNAAGETVGEISLAAEAVFHLLEVPAAQGGGVLIATGNPGRIWHLDLTRLDASAPDVSPAERGLTTWGEIRDRNVRRLALDAPGRVLAGSAPEGNLYRFARSGAAPEILFDNERAEVTDIHVADNGDVFATVVFGSDESNQRVAGGTSLEVSTEPPQANDSRSSASSIMEAAPAEISFSGRTHLVRIPGGDGLAETVASRGNISIYRIIARGDVLLLAGGDQGELLGYDMAAHRSLTFAGSDSAQINALLPLDPAADVSLALANNPAALLRIDFTGSGPRTATTRRLDLRSDGRLGALRFNRLRGIEPAEIDVEFRSNRGRDEVEGWSAWSAATESEGGWRADGLRGQYAQLRLTLPADFPPDAEIDRGRLFHLPQNRRPVLQSFQVAPPNLAVVPRSDAGNASLPTLGQVLANTETANDGRRQSAVLGNAVVPEPGAQIVTWAIRDADEDRLVASFAVRHEAEERWFTLAERVETDWVQFDRRTLREGIYFTRLTVAETSPRPAEDRREVVFETDDLVIDLSAPKIVDARIESADGSSRVVVTVSVHDTLSLPQRVAFGFNNGYRTELGQPVDGILDGRSETFVLSLSPDRVAGATAVEIQVEDAAGNRGATRLPLP